MSKPKDQGNYAAKQKQTKKKKICQGKDLIACIIKKLKKKSFTRKEANRYKEMRRKKNS